MNREPTSKGEQSEFDVQKEKQILFWASVEFLFDLDKYSKELTGNQNQNNNNSPPPSRVWEIQTYDTPEPEHLAKLDVNTVELFYMHEKIINGRLSPESIGVKINDSTEDRRYYLLRVTNAGASEEVSTTRITEDNEGNLQAQAAEREDILDLKAVLFALRGSYPRPLATP